MSNMRALGVGVRVVCVRPLTSPFMRIDILIQSIAQESFAGEFISNVWYDMSALTHLLGLSECVVWGDPPHRQIITPANILDASL